MERGQTITQLPADWKPDPVDISPEAVELLCALVANDSRIPEGPRKNTEAHIRALRSALTASEKQVSAYADELAQAQHDIANAVIEERLACAAIANAVGDKKDGGHSLGYRSAGWEIAELIKARGAHGA